MQFEPFLDIAFGGSMRQLLRLGNQNGKGPQQYVSIPFFDGIRVHTFRYVLTVPHSVANVRIGEFHFASTDNLSTSEGSTSSVNVPLELLNRSEMFLTGPTSRLNDFVFLAHVRGLVVLLNFV
jgi:hypothetical protein